MFCHSCWSRPFFVLREQREAIESLWVLSGPVLSGMTLALIKMLILTNLMHLFPVAVVDVFASIPYLACIVVTLSMLKSG